MNLFRMPRHPVAMAGGIIAFVAAQALLIFIVLDLIVPRRNPYIGVFAYLVIPAILLLGLVVLGVGTFIERRQMKRHGTLPPRPRLDLNLPRHRRIAGMMAAGVLALLLLTATLEYRTYTFTETSTFCGQTCHTVMKPEFVAYSNSPHARVSCTDCHVGPGASWWVKSKISGAHQLIAVALNSYPRPIPGPIKSLRPAQVTCEQCHWPEKFHGSQLKLFTHYSNDEQNTRRQLQLLLKTGGGSATQGASSGIHWHMNIANAIEYISRDSLRQDIPWVRFKDSFGRVRVFQSTTNPLTPAEIAAAKPRRVDCMDCHNRPTHIFPAPTSLVDESLYQERIDASLPYIRRELVAALDAEYPTEPAAMEGISARVVDFYQKQYPAVWSERGERVKGAIAEAQRIYSISTFPEMKVNWKTYPTNVGHMIFPGCFRCHDGAHAGDDGTVISKDCQACHVILGQIEGTAQNMNPSEPLGGGVPFVHPEDLGMDMSEANCTECHGPQ